MVRDPAGFRGLLRRMPDGHAIDSFSRLGAHAPSKRKRRRLANPLDVGAVGSSPNTAKVSSLPTPPSVCFGASFESWPLGLWEEETIARVRREK
jgi:hypothetical protein